MWVSPVTSRDRRAWRSTAGLALALFLFSSIWPVVAAGPDGRASSPYVGDLTESELEPKHEPEMGPQTFPRSGYLWPHGTGPYYGDAVGSRERTAAGVFHSAVGSFRLDRGALPFPPELTATNKLDRQGSQYFIVQVRPETLTRERLEGLHAKIRGAGGEVVRHLPVAALIARLTPEAHAAVLGTRDLVAVEPYHPALKLDPAIGRTPLYDPRKALSDSYSLDVVLHPGEDSKAAAAAIRTLGGDVTHVWASRIRIELPARALTDLAAIDAVAMVHEHLPYLPQDQKITNAVQTGGIRGNANPFHDAGIRGAGQVLMVLDNGIQLDAGDLSDTSTAAGTAGPSHRKVLFYGTTSPFGGSGDDRGCDALTQGAFTHGHLVSAIAVGNPEHADVTFRATDASGGLWDLTGVAPDARLVAYDANVTPAVGSCQDTLLGVLDVGQLYDASPAGAGSLNEAYVEHGARIFNFSWGSNGNVYNADSLQIDTFLRDYPEALVFAAVGNQGRDSDNNGVPDPGSIGAPATAKNILSIGSHGGPDDFSVPENIDERSFFSGVGPAGAPNRVAPVLMAPGQERGTTGRPISFSCRTGDNASIGPVVCDGVSGKAGTSYATAAASGAGLLVRDYFAQGFYPDGTAANPGNAADVVPVVSGALVKAMLIASAEFLGRNFRASTASIDNLTKRQRFNNEQGYGRIQLDNALPLAGWSATPTGLIVADGGIPGGVNSLAADGLSGTIDAVGGQTQEATVEICDDSQELRIALAWTDAPGDALVNNLDLTVIAPDGRTYFGNYHTDDDNGNGRIDLLLEDCPSLFDDGTDLDGGLDRSEWSLATCVRPGNGTIPPSLPPHDSKNPTEAVFLSPNPEGRLTLDGLPRLRTGNCADASGDACGYDAQCNGVPCLGGTSQTQAGTYTVRVAARSGGSNGAQGYALVIAGGVCAGSSTAFDASRYVCSDQAVLTVNERSEASDPAGGLSAAVVAARTLVEVIDGDGTVRDAESGSDLGFLQAAPNALRFVSSGVTITDGTAYDPGNGILDVQHGDTLRVIYRDESVGGVGGDPDKVRVAEAVVDCRADILVTSRFAQFGENTTTLLTGGCERNARGLFEFGYPDRYMDAQESLTFRFAFTSASTDPLVSTVAELSCVFADSDSPPGCRPGSTECPDPDRLNNPPCTDLRILDPYQVINLIDPRSAVSANFQIQMNSVIHGSPVVEMLLRVTAANVGRNQGALLVQRHRLNVDEASVRYNTDFPQGGTLTWDRNNNGLIENPATTGVTGFPTSNNTDYVFETVQYSDLTQGTDADGNAVVVNDGIQAPWNFDNNDGGFTTGLVAGTDDSLISETIAQWGEDKNFNNLLDGHCQARASQACRRFPTDPVDCGFCDAAASNPGEPCTVTGDCPGGTCDFTCVNLEDRDPQNFPVALLDQNWSTRGGCGWQTKAPGTCSGDASVGCYNDGDCAAAGLCTGPAPATGGIWHTGRIGRTTETQCGIVGDTTGQCQLYETIGGLTGQLVWFELLVTPELTKVNQELDASGLPLATAEIGEFRFNWAVDMPDNNVSVTWEFDNDTEKLEPVDLKSDFTVLITSTGDYGAINGGGNPFLTRGWGLFAPIDPSTGLSKNGTVGNNRVGKNSCFFENGAIPNANLEYAFTGLPPDDDLNEGYCPSGQGRGGTDNHLNYCTTVCSGRSTIGCAAEADCGQGTCIGGVSGFCSNNQSVACGRVCTAGPRQGQFCTSDNFCLRCDGGPRHGLFCNDPLDCPQGVCPPAGVCSINGDPACDLGTCVDTVCNGACVAGACTNGKPGTCAGDADCAEACVFTTAAIDEFVQPNGPVRGVELNDYNGPDMRFSTLLDIFATSNWGIPTSPRVPSACVGSGENCGMPLIVWREPIGVILH